MKLGNRSRDIRDAIMDELRKNGITKTAVEMRGSHPAVVFLHNGTKMFVTFPASPSDQYRSAKNARTWVRQMLAGVNTRIKT